MWLIREFGEPVEDTGYFNLVDSINKLYLISSINGDKIGVDNVRHLLTCLHQTRVWATFTRGLTLLAVAHSILVIAYRLMERGEDYTDLGVDYFDKREPERLARHLTKRLVSLGFEVNLTPVAKAWV